jgi:hypothetical protein
MGFRSDSEKVGGTTQRRMSGTTSQTGRPGTDDLGWEVATVFALLLLALLFG